MPKEKIKEIQEFAERLKIEFDFIEIKAKKGKQVAPSSSSFSPTNHSLSDNPRNQDYQTRSLQDHVRPSER